MKTDVSFELIDEEAFDSTLQQYDNVISERLKELDEQRYNVIPAAVKNRDEDPMLSKEEVATLVKWKLSHGKFRPTLQALVQRNAESIVKELTSDTFKSFSKGDKSLDQAKQAINSLAKLQGIGPATASLLLSVFDPDTVPFFSDELFRWAFLEDGKGKAWDREIKYNIKEFLELYSKVQDFRARFKKQFDQDVAAVQMEKLAYVLGKTQATRNTAANGKKRKAEVDDSGHISVDSAPTTMSNNSSSHKKARASASASGPGSSSEKPASPDNPTATSSRPKRKKK